MKIVPVLMGLPMGFYIVFAFILGSVLLFCLIKKSFRRVRNFRRIAIVGMMLLLVLRPTQIISSGAPTCVNANVFFAVDFSGEMTTRDFMGETKQRFEMAVLDMREIAKKFSGAQFGIVVNDYRRYVDLPLTSDAEAFELSAETLTPTGVVGAETETSFGEYLAEQLDESARRYPERQNYVFVLTDKEDRHQTGDELVRRLGARLAGGLVLDYGDNTGSERQSGVDYFERGDSYRMSGAPAERVEALVEQAKASGNTEYFEYYWLIALVILALLIWEFADILDRLLMERKVEYN